MREVIEATWGWNEEWQRADFAKRFGESEYFVIEASTTALGALCLERRAEAIYILELQLLPEYQGSGIGTDVIRGVIRDATRENLAVALSVVHANHRAKRLYVEARVRGHWSRAAFHSNGARQNSQLTQRCSRRQPAPREP